MTWAVETMKQGDPRPDRPLAGGDIRAEACGGLGSDAPGWVGGGRGHGSRGTVDHVWRRPEKARRPAWRKQGPEVAWGGREKAREGVGEDPARLQKPPEGGRISLQA